MLSRQINLQSGKKSLFEHLELNKMTYDFTDKILSNLPSMKTIGKITKGAIGCCVVYSLYNCRRVLSLISNFIYYLFGIDLSKFTWSNNEGIENNSVSKTLVQEKVLDNTEFMKQLQSSYNETRKTALELLDNFKITKKVYDLITANFDYILLEPDPIKILHICDNIYGNSIQKLHNCYADLAVTVDYLKITNASYLHSLVDNMQLTNVMDMVSNNKDYMVNNNKFTFDNILYQSATNAYHDLTDENIKNVPFHFINKDLKIVPFEDIENLNDEQFNTITENTKKYFENREYEEQTVNSFYNRLFRKNLRYDNNIIMENIITRNQFNRLENSIPIIDNNIYNTTASLPDIHNPNIISTFTWLAGILGISITALISYLYYRFYRKEDNNNSNSEGNTTYLDKNHQEINFDDIEKQIKQTDDELRFRGK